MPPSMPMAGAWRALWGARRAFGEQRLAALPCCHGDEQRSCCCVRCGRAGMPACLLAGCTCSLALLAWGLEPCRMPAHLPPAAAGAAARGGLTTSAAAAAPPAAQVGIRAPTPGRHQGSLTRAASGLPHQGPCSAPAYACRSATMVAARAGRSRLRSLVKGRGRFCRAAAGVVTGGTGEVAKRAVCDGL